MDEGINQKIVGKGALIAPLLLSGVGALCPKEALYES